MPFRKHHFWGSDLNSPLVPSGNDQQELFLLGTTLKDMIKIQNLTRQQSSIQYDVFSHLKSCCWFSIEFDDL